MADLYQVYGGFAEEEMYDNYEQPSTEKKRRKESAPPAVQQPSVQMPAVQIPSQQQAPSVPISSQQHQPQTKESFQNMRYQSQQNYTFWDKMSMKRGDVIKLAIFSLVIVLGIAIDRIGTHYINKYLSDNILTNFQEFMIRLSYPIVVFLILWIIKSL